MSAISPTIAASRPSVAIRQDLTYRNSAGPIRLPPMAPDYSHIVFPELNSDLYRSRQERVAETLDAIQSAIEKEKRDLRREAKGEPPVEGVGTQVARQMQ